MSKYILDIGKYWEHNDKCPLCKAIDNELSYIDNLKKKKISKLSIQQEMNVLESMLVNGYDLIDIYEANHVPHKNILNKLIAMPSYNDDVVNSVVNLYGNEAVKRQFDEFNAKEPTLIFSRFCKDCGARKPDIFDTECLKNLKNLTFEVKLLNIEKPVDVLHSQEISLTWGKIDYDFKYSYRILKKADNDVVSETTDSLGYHVLYETDNITNMSYMDLDFQDGRAYYYKLQYINECGEIIREVDRNILVPCYYDHIPKKITNLHFMKHRKLIRHDDLTYTTYDYVTAEYDVDKDDKDFGDVFFKLNEEHVPSVDFWHDDIEFHNHDEFVFADKKKRYFMKPYIRSRLFKKDWVNDHDIYPDLYFWNKDMPVQFFSYEFFRDDLYGLEFIEGKRSMTIKYHLKIKNNVKYVRIMFKQDNKYITDDDDGTYKVVDVPAVHALYDYEVDIHGLASNSYWVFGVFPVYEDSTPDIRLEYQKIVKIKPWYEKMKIYDSPIDFYYVGKWYYDLDFDKYNLPTWDKIKTCESRNKKVMMCDKINMKDVSVLLIHDDDCAECFTVNFDYKMIAKTNKDRLHYFMNHQPQLKVSNTYDKWIHFKRSYFNYDYMILRWEQMKFADIPWTCTYVDNVTVTNETIIDTDTDNFTRNDTIKYTNFHYYNRQIKHNALYQHTPEKFYGVDIKINDYYEANVMDENKNGISDDKEMTVFGKPDEEFTWLP